MNSIRTLRDIFLLWLPAAFGVYYSSFYVVIDPQPIGFGSFGGAEGIPHNKFKLPDDGYNDWVVAAYQPAYWIDRTLLPKRWKWGPGDEKPGWFSEWEKENPPSADVITIPEKPFKF